jgi:Putative beta barrel porin-7 (BBP7)
VTAALRMLLSTCVAVLLVGAATAQDLPRLEMSDLDAPPEAFTLMPSEPTPSMDSSGSPEASMMIGPVRSGVDSLTKDDTACGCDPTAPSAYDLWDMEPVPIESTGTWLQRGLWYAEADVTVMMRQWSRHSLVLVSQDGQQAPLSSFNRFLVLERSHPGQDAGVRTTLGRYLFRDGENRDHTTEFTVFISGDFEQNKVLGSPVGQLQVPFQISGNNQAFDGSTRDTAIYSSRFNSFEWNYRVQRRMERDQMVMDPNGQWTRKASPGFTKEFLAGVRFLELSEILDWRAEDVQVAGNNGKYLIQTDNDLIGLQLGAGFTYETARWSIGLDGKGGAYANTASRKSQLDFSIDDSADFSNHGSEDQLSFIGESALDLKYHLTPNFSLRTGLHLLYVTAVAEAPFQANFLSDYNTVVTSGNPLYFGASAGFEGYW